MQSADSIPWYLGREKPIPMSLIEKLVVLSEAECLQLCESHNLSVSMCERVLCVAIGRREGGSWIGESGGCNVY